MRVLLSTYELCTDVEATVGRARQLRAVGAEMPVCAAPAGCAALVARGVLASGVWR